MTGVAGEEKGTNSETVDGRHVQGEIEMGNVSKYGDAKVRPQKQANEYGGRHRGSSGYVMPAEYQPSLLDIYEIDRVLKSLSKVLNRYEEMQKLRPQDPMDITPEEAKKALSWLGNQVLQPLRGAYKIPIPQFDASRFPLLNNAVDNARKIKIEEHYKDEMEHLKNDPLD